MKALVLAVALALALPVHAGDYQSEVTKRKICRDMGDYAVLVLRSAKRGGTLAFSQGDVGFVKPLFAFIEREIGGNSGYYSEQEAADKGWAYCMDNIDTFAARY